MQFCVLLASTFLLASLTSCTASHSYFKYKLSATSKLQLTNIILNCTHQDGPNATHFDFVDLLPWHHHSDEDTLRQCTEAGEFSYCFTSQLTSNPLIEPEVVHRVSKLTRQLDHLKELFCFSNESRAEFRQSLACFRHPQVVFKFVELTAKYATLKRSLSGDEGFNREIECCLEYARIGELKGAISETCQDGKFGKLAEDLMQDLSFGSLLGIYKVCSSSFGMGKSYQQCKSALPLSIASRLPSKGNHTQTTTTTTTTTTRRPSLSRPSDSVNDTAGSRHRRSAAASPALSRSKDSFSIEIEYESNDEKEESVGDDDDDEEDDSANNVEEGDDYSTEAADNRALRRPKHQNDDDDDDDSPCDANDEDEEEEANDK